MRQNTKKAVYKEQPVRAAGVRTALRRRELKRFFSSAAYMLNCGIGSLFMILAAVFVLIRTNWIRGVIADLAETFPSVGDLLPMIATAMIVFLACANTITTPSVSLEGSSLWQIQSLPVAPAEALRAKLETHWLITIPPLLLCGAALCFAMQISLTDSLLILLTGVLFVMLQAAAGLALNLKMPNLTWLEETVAIKQGLPMVIILFGGWGSVLVLGAVYFLLHNLLSPKDFLLVCIVLLALFTRLLHNWLNKKGAAVFASL